MIPSEQVHFFFSFFRNFLMPFFLINSRLSIMLIPYLIRYLLSRFLNLLHGNFSQLSEQNFQLFFFRILQFLIMHFLQYCGFLFISLQPGHLFFSLRYPKQIAQFIPQGAINLVVNAFMNIIRLSGPVGT